MTKLTTEELREPWCLKCGRKASDHNVRHPFQPSHELPSIHDLAAENAALRAEVEKLREALTHIDSIDPQDRQMSGLSDHAARGLINTAGSIARDALSKGGA